MKQQANITRIIALKKVKSKSITEKRYVFQLNMPSLLQIRYIHNSKLQILVVLKKFIITYLFFQLQPPFYKLNNIL